MKAPEPRLELLDQFLAHQHGAERLIAGGDSLGDGDDVGHHAFGLAGEQRAASPHAAHHLVEDHQRAVLVADAADLA
jgi:hypothetical protein